MPQTEEDSAEDCPSAASFWFNLNRINETLLSRLPSDVEIQTRLSTPRFSRTSLVRVSKFRHTYGRVGRKEDCYEGLKTTRISHDGNLCAVNTKFIAVVVESAGGGVFTVLPIHQTGRVLIGYPKVCGHTGPISDIKWNPFNEGIIASSSDDTTIKLWKIPDCGLVDNMTEWWKNLQGHLKKVGHLEWHPTAKDILLSAGNDQRCIVWNVASATAAHVICVHSDNILSLAWNRDGSLFATTSKDKRIRVIDPRTENIVAQGEGHPGSKTSKVVFLDKKRLLTTGFSRLSERQFAIWDTDNMNSPLKQENLDISSGVLTPYYDFDTKVLFIAGKGDGNIRYYEVVEDAPYIFYLSQYLSSSPQGGLGQMPKKGVNARKCEIVRFYKLHTMKDIIEPLSMIVPRKSELFQEDLFPPTSGVTSSMTAEEWLSGMNCGPVLVSFKELMQSYSAPVRRAVSKEALACESGMPNNCATFDAHSEVHRRVPGSIRNIMRLSGSDFEPFLSDRGEKLDDENSSDIGSHKTPLQCRSFTKYECNNFSCEKLNCLNLNSVNNNHSHLPNGTPNTEDELRKAFVAHSNEIKRLRDTLAVKDLRIQELKEELSQLRMARNVLNNARPIEEVLESK